MKNPRKHSLHGGFDEFPDEEEEPVPNTISKPKPIEEEPIFPTIHSIEDCTPLTKTWSMKNPRKHSLHGVFDEFPDEEEEPMPNTISEPKHGSQMNHSNHIERLKTPRVISSTSFMMSYLINIGRRNPPREGKETRYTIEN
jgi:hypothetical protein